MSVCFYVVLSFTLKDYYISLEPRLSIPDFVSQLWRKREVRLSHVWPFWHACILILVLLAIATHEKSVEKVITNTLVPRQNPERRAWVQGYCYVNALHVNVNTRTCSVCVWLFLIACQPIFFASIWLTWYAWLNLCFYLFYEWINHNIFFCMLFFCLKSLRLSSWMFIKKSLKCFHLQFDTSIVFKFSGITQYVEDMVILYTSVSLNTANGPSHSIHTVCLNNNTAKLQPFIL